MSTATEPRPLTARQMAIFRYVYEHARDRGYQPSHRQIAREFGMAGSGSFFIHARPLARKGWIARTLMHSRSVGFLLRPDGLPFEGFADRPALGPPAGTLPRRTAEFHALVYRLARDRGSQPSVREAMSSMGLRSPNSITLYLERLRAEGWIGPPAASVHKVSLVIRIRPDGSPFTGFADKEPSTDGPPP